MGTVGIVRSEVEHPAEVGSVIEIVDRQTGETRLPVSPCVMPLPG
jgi:hypothetical protein